MGGAHSPQYFPAIRRVGSWQEFLLSDSRSLFALLGIGWKESLQFEHLGLVLSLAAIYALLTLL